MLTIVGLGPGGKDQMTHQALSALERADVIVGYTTYVRLIRDLAGDKEIISTGMKKEVERCQKAIELAKEGHEVAVISSGDAGVYGMAGLIFELISRQDLPLKVNVIPGVTASIAGAAVLGAPLMNDFCHISLSDLMTPWEVIEKRLHASAGADFVICLYNPRSKGRPDHLSKAIAIIKKYKAPETIVGIAKDIGRKQEQTVITTLAAIDVELVDMTTVVLIGNKETYQFGPRMITPRGYTL